MRIVLSWCLILLSFQICSAETVENASGTYLGKTVGTWMSAARSGSSTVRIDALENLSTLTMMHVFPALLAELPDDCEEKKLRSGNYQANKSIVPEISDNLHEELVTLYLEIMNDPDHQVACTAAAILGRAKAIRALPRLAAFLENTVPDKDARFTLSGVENFGSTAATLTPVIFRIMGKSDDNAFQEACMGLLAHIAPAESFPTCLELARAAKAEVKYPWIEAIGMLARRHPSTRADAVDFLTRILRERAKEPVVIPAAQALAGIGSEAKAAVPDLLPILKHEDYNVRKAAVEALSRIDPKSPVVYRALVPLKEDSFLDVREAAVEACCRSGNERSRGPVHEAILAGNAASLAAIIAASPSCLEERGRSDKRGAFGMTPLLFAAETGDREAFEFLLNKGANALATDSRGDSSLHIALSERHPDIAEILLKTGIDANLKGHLGDTPLHRACDASATALLLAHGADPNRLSDLGKPPLYYAVCVCNLEWVRLLLAKGAKADWKDVSGESLAVFAKDLGAPEIAELLVQYGASR